MEYWINLRWWQSDLMPSFFSKWMKYVWWDIRSRPCDYSRYTFFFASFLIIYWKTSHQIHIHTSSPNGLVLSTITIFRYMIFETQLNTEYWAWKGVEISWKIHYFIHSTEISYAMHTCKVKSILDKITCIIEISYSHWVLFVRRRPGCRVPGIIVCSMLCAMNVETNIFWNLNRQWSWMCGRMAISE